MRDWITGWVKTLRIMIFDRETYRFLRDHEINPDDLVEVPRPR